MSAAAISLRPYQVTAVEQLRASYRAGNRAPLFQLATGGGKTYVFCYVANGAASLGNRSLILVHRKELLTQASMSLAKIGLRHSIIAPDKAVRECMSNHVEELSRPFVDMAAPVGVASVDTLINRLGSIRSPFLIIPDESHHAVPGNKWGKVISAFPDARILGVTATPTRSDGRGLGKASGGFFDDMICGPQMRELIGVGALLQPTVFAPPVVANLQGIGKQAGDYAVGELAERMDKPSITGDAVKHYARICPGVPAIAFCVSVAHAQHVAEQFKSAGFDFRYIDGKMESNERRMLIRALARGKIHGLTSCDLISEGTDIPVVGCGILLRPTMSLVVYLQQVGRILRPSLGQDRAFILDHVGNCMIHGLPEADREWSLEGRKKKAKKAGDAEAVLALTACPKCYAMHSPAPSCPQCGHVYENRGRQIEEQDGELQEVTGELAAALRKTRRQEEGRAQTYDEFLKLARERSYENPEGWARIRVNLRRKRAQSLSF